MGFLCGHEGEEKAGLEVAGWAGGVLGARVGGGRGKAWVRGRWGGG